MSPIIKLHWRSKPLYININKILCFYQSEKNDFHDCTYIETEKDYFYVDESPDEVESLIREQMNFLKIQNYRRCNNC